MAETQFSSLRLAFRNSLQEVHETKQYDLDHIHFAHYLTLDTAQVTGLSFE